MLQTISNPTLSAFSYGDQNNKKQAQGSCRHNSLPYFHHLSLHHTSTPERKVHFSNQVTIYDQAKTITALVNFNDFAALKIDYEIREYNGPNPICVLHKFRERFLSHYTYVNDSDNKAADTATTIFGFILDQALDQIDYHQDFAAFKTDVTQYINERFVIEVDRPRSDLQDDPNQVESSILYGYAEKAKKTLQELLLSNDLWRGWLHNIYLQQSIALVRKVNRPNPML